MNTFSFNTVSGGGRSAEAKFGISDSLIDTAVGTFGAKATDKGIEMIPDERLLPRIGFNEIALAFSQNEDTVPHTVNEGVITVSGQSMIGMASSIEGARAIVAYIQNGRKAFFPAVFVPNSNGKSHWLEMLTTKADVRNPSDPTQKTKALSDLQQQLLDVALGQSMEGSGTSHGSNGAVNAGEAGHGALIAVSVSPKGIHNKTHELGESNKLADEVTKVNIYTDRGVRPTGTRLVHVGQLDEIYICNSLQVPPVPTSVFRAGAGIVLAAVGTRKGHDAPIVDLAKNLAAMNVPLSVNTNGSHVHAH